MKLKIGNNVYLQRYEVSHIMHELGSGIPGGMILELMNDEKGFFFESTYTDGFRFEFVIMEPENAEWLMKQDWIVDYTKYAIMSLARLESIRKHLKIRLSAAIDDFNAKDEAYRGAHFYEQSARFNRISYKIASLGILISFRKGEIEFVFPDEYRRKTAATHNNIVSANTFRKKPSFLTRLLSRGSAQ